MKETVKIIDKWYGGQVRDDKSKITGAAFNFEELDIFENQNFIRSTQLMTSDAMPASTEIYAYTAGADDTVYGVGKETSANKIRIVSVASGGTDNPGAFGTLFTSADATNISTKITEATFFKTSETAGGYIYYITANGGTITLKRYSVTGAAEATVGTLTGLDGSFDRPTQKVIYGELFICNGIYIAKVDKDGVFNEKAFTMPSDWEAVDIIPVSDVALLLAKNTNRLVNQTRCFWWDLTSTTQFNDSFSLPVGGPQWMVNYQEKITIFCAINGQGRFFQLTGAFQGAKPVELPSLILTNVAAETTTQPISMSKMLSTKDKILYFGLYKTDKTGIFALGQLDGDKSTAVCLAKRFDTSDYSLHKPTSLLIQGSNFYASFDDNGAADHSRCESNNSPTRSSNGVYESVWIDFDNPFSDKSLSRAYISSYPLSASTSLDLYVATDYSSSYTQIKRADNTIFNTANGLLGLFRPAAFNNKKVYRVKVLWTRSTTNSPKLTAIGLRGEIKNLP